MHIVSFLLIFNQKQKTTIGYHLNVTSETNLRQYKSYPICQKSHDMVTFLQNLIFFSLFDLIYVTSSLVW